MLSTLNGVIEHERQVAGTFATLCTLQIDADRRAMQVRRAGHPPPVLIIGGSVTGLPDDRGGPPIGVIADAHWPASRFELPADWSLLLYTDGVIEGRVDGGARRLGEDGLHRLIGDYVRGRPQWRGDPDRMVRELIERATQLNGEELGDDVAVVSIGTR